MIESDATYKMKEDLIRMADKKAITLAKKNDQVKVIRVSDPAVIVEHCRTKERFSTAIDNLK